MTGGFSAARGIGVFAVLASLAMAPPDDAPAREPLLKGLGAHRRAVTTRSPEAQAYFDQGLALLFAFNHDEAERAFRQAVAIDPACAMAWWGVAVAQGPHINLPVVAAERNQAAVEAITKARANRESLTPVERALIDAASRRYASPPPEDRKPLDHAYAEAMRAAWKAFPRDADVGALFAESLMDLSPWDQWSPEGEPRPGTREVLETLEAVLAIQPDHPLGCHLTIHALEASPRPERALTAADRLRQLQPGLAHMVHMPSHIDVRLGHWKEAEEANDRAIEADRAYRAIRPKQGFYRIYMIHNRHMLAYAALMRGKSRRAIEAIDAMIAEIPLDWARENAAIADGIFAMPLEVRMRFGRWDEILAAPEPEAVFTLARALRHAARGVALAALKRPAEARESLAAFRTARGKVAPEARFGNSAASSLLDLAEHLLLGEILYREGQRDEGIAELRLAVRAEDTLHYDEPPDWIQPVRHALGAALIDAGRLDEAEVVYREDLAKLPENGWSLFGLWRIAELRGREDEAKAAKARWEAAWKDADVTLTSSCFCLPAR